MSNWKDRYEMVIGLEVHTHLKTRSKLFSPAPVQYGLEPNHSVHPDGGKILYAETDVRSEIWALENFLGAEKARK